MMMMRMKAKVKLVDEMLVGHKALYCAAQAFFVHTCSLLVLVVVMMLSNVRWLKDHGVALSLTECLSAA